MAIERLLTDTQLNQVSEFVDGLLIERIQVLDIKPTDLIVFKIKDEVNNQDFESTSQHVRELCKQWFPANKVIVTRDVDVSVIRQDTTE